MDLIVEKSGDGWRARFRDRLFRCAVGRAALIAADLKREGDGATPIGRWRMRRVLFRPDRIGQIKTTLPQTALTPKDGWCDAPDDLCYNQQVALPYASNHEILWREDHLYDILVVLDHNSKPVIPGRGSAIFLHLARENYEATEGCVALARADLLDVLREVNPESAVMVTSTP